HRLPIRDFHDYLSWVGERSSTPEHRGGRNGCHALHEPPNDFCDIRVGIAREILAHLRSVDHHGEVENARSEVTRTDMRPPVFARLAIEQLILRREKVDAGLDCVCCQCMADVNCTVYT